MRLYPISGNTHLLHASLFACSLLIAGLSTSASQAESPLGTQMYALLKTTRERGASPQETADVFVEWMNNNDWKSMDIHDHYNLYSLINVDSVDRCHFSARWTGFLTAPSTSEYTLRQVRVYRGTNSHLKITVDGNIILDTTSTSVEDQLYTSTPIKLVANEPVSIQVELVHDVTRIDHGEGAPMVLLTWERNGRKAELIPSSAFSPPEGFGSPGGHGLKAEYFATTDFKDLRLTRLDAALDSVWSWPPTASKHDELARQVFDTCTAKILDSEFLAQSVQTGDLDVLNYNLWRIAYRMSGAQRQQLVELLVRQPTLLVEMTPEGMSRLYQAVYMLPGDEQVEMVGEWALARSQPHCRAGQLPGWGEGFYQQLNTDFYWLLGLFMQGPYWNDAERLRDLYLERANGDCNLVVAYTLAYAGRANGTSSAVNELLTSKIDDPEMTGDRLVTWLIARAFASEVEGPSVEPLRGYLDLDSAYVSAESDEYKFWALEEMVARLSSADKGELAKKLIEENGNRFNSAGQQAAMAHWNNKTDELASIYFNKQVVHEEAIQSAYRSELERRRERATQQGDAAAVERYGELISSTSEAQP